jgi:hypothetical protein
MEKTRIALLIVAIVAALGCLGFMGVRAFGTKVYQSRDCDFANIDNIEMHARIDIPDIKDCDCRYDARLLAKKVTFTLDTGAVDLDDYIKSNRFKKFEENQSLHQSLAFATDLAQSDRTQLFYRSNESSHKPGRDLYRMVINPETGKMWVYLQYD